MFKLNFGKSDKSAGSGNGGTIHNSGGSGGISGDDDSVEIRKPTKDRLFMRPGIIEEEPDSMDSIISNPASFPITIVPTSLIRSSTQQSFGRYSRQSSTRNRGIRPGTVRKSRRRAILKNGDCNIIQKKIAQRKIKFLQDIFTTLVDSQWRWTLLVFALGFILTWLGFAVVWWLITFTHGDFELAHLPQNQHESNWRPCVYNIHNFASCFLFSIETQHTIGYGVRTTTEECPEAIFVMCFQSITGVMVQAFMVGIVFAKMTRPKRRTQTLLFSKNAVICQRDNELTLMFRVGDMRKSHIIGLNVRAQLIKNRMTREGELLAQYQTELQIGADACKSDLFFIWPLIIVHKINAKSPFYNLSATDMLHERFEIVVFLEGTVESTGQSTQARTSYLNTEILWGHRFTPIVSYNRDEQGFEIDYSKFNETYQIDTPLCSAKQLADICGSTLSGGTGIGGYRAADGVASGSGGGGGQKQQEQSTADNPIVNHTDLVELRRLNVAAKQLPWFRSNFQNPNFNRPRRLPATLDERYMLSDTDSDSIKTQPGWFIA